MPGGDGTGPTGMGPATGGGIGPCGAGMRAYGGFGWGRGSGRGRGGGRGRRGWRNLQAFAEAPPKGDASPDAQHLAALQQQVEDLTAVLEQTRRQIEQLRGRQADKGQGPT